MFEILKKNSSEIIYNLINSFIAGGLVFLGSLTSGHISGYSVLLSLVAAGAVALTKFKDYWATQENEYSQKMFNFY